MKIKNKLTPHLAVVVLFWNESKKTIRCLESIYNQKKIKLNVVLIDNNSNIKFNIEVRNWLNKNKIRIIDVDNSFFQLKGFKTNKNCFFIKNKKNLGCGLGHNPGYKFCLKHNFEFIARIDNDMFLPPNLLFNLIKRFNNKRIVALSPKVMFYKNPKKVWFRGATIGNNLKFQKQCANYIPGHLDNKKFKGLVQTDAIVGCASIMRSNILKNTGLSDPDFFYGEEDIELSYRLKKKGGELYIDLNEKIYHDVSSTVGKNWGKNIYYNYKYRLVLINKIGSNLDKIFGYSISVFKLILSIFLIFGNKHSSRFLQRYYGIKHFFQSKLGDYDRKNYNKINSFFFSINKKTSFLQILRHILNNRIE